MAKRKRTVAEKYMGVKPKPPRGYTTKSYRAAVKKHGLAGPRKPGRGA